MKIIKGVLEEELKKALHAREECEKALAALPRGVLVKKYVKGRQYCYLLSREKGKVRFAYKGKLPGKDIKYYGEIKKDRARYRNLLSEVKKRIAFIHAVVITYEMLFQPEPALKSPEACYNMKSRELTAWGRVAVVIRAQRGCFRAICKEKRRM